jgi:acyl-CoA synthetase (AMP-forming)/AMP-acid ligase II
MIANFIRSAVGVRRLNPAVFFYFSDSYGTPAGAEITKENAQLIIDKWVKENKVVLFMKGTPLAPLCGYSNFVVELLKKYGTQFGTQD